MTIFLLAIAAGLVTWVGFIFIDRKVKVPGQRKERKDYNQITFSIRYRLFLIFSAGSVIYCVGYIFYKNMAVAFFMSCLGILYPLKRRKELVLKQKHELGVQFKHALYSLSSSLVAGRSVENAFQEACKDLKILYADVNTPIIQEFELINRRVANGEPIESAIRDFSARTGHVDIANFSEVFTTCKRTGGDLVEVVRRTSNMIGEKIEIQQEIRVMVSQKRFESKVINVVPFVIIAFLEFSSPDYMLPLYEGSGVLVMTLSLILLLFCSWLSSRIMNIRV